MSVKRCGFFTDGVNLFRKDLFIDWDLGFDSKAKHTYIQRELGEDLSPCVDVTTASPIRIARNLSPHLLRLSDGSSFIDTYGSLREHGLFDLAYYLTLSKEQHDYVSSAKCFIDVSYTSSPGTMTQARSLAVLQMLQKQHQLELLMNVNDFLDWFHETCQEIII